MGLSRHFSPQNLSCCFASHVDPDIVASLDRSMTFAPAKLVISRARARARARERFTPHSTKAGNTDNRIIVVPGQGGSLVLGRNERWFLTAHFLQSKGQRPFLRTVHAHADA
jgi:flavorubredoxin